MLRRVCFDNPPTYYASTEIVIAGDAVEERATERLIIFSERRCRIAARYKFMRSADTCL
jgi:hypothetical protein